MLFLVVDDTPSVSEQASVCQSIGHQADRSDTLAKLLSVHATPPPGVIPASIRFSVITEKMNFLLFQTFASATPRIDAFPSFLAFFFESLRKASQTEQQERPEL